MSLQIQLRRGLIALIIGLALCGFVLGRAGSVDGSGPQRVGAGMHVAAAAPRCTTRLQVQIEDDVRISVDCGGACAPLGRMLRTLHVVAVPRPDCTPTLSA